MELKSRVEVFLVLCLIAMTIFIIGSSSKVTGTLRDVLCLQIFHGWKGKAENAVKFVVPRVTGESLFPFSCRKYGIGRNYSVSKNQHRGE